MAATPLPIAIVGAGLSGLTCARYLHAAGLPVRVFEQRGRIGGRVATDAVEGFQLDHGFQVFLTAYPEAKALLDYDALDLKPFVKGALVRLDEAFHFVGDPLRHPTRAPLSLLSPIGSLADKLRVLRLRNRLMADTIEVLFSRPEMTAEDALRNRWKFSSSIIETFFRPFFGGVTLDPSLTASSRTLEFLFRMFAEGDACLPARGMRAIPEQLAAGLPEGGVTLNATVAAVRPDGLTLADGREIAARAVVLATEAPAARALFPAADARLAARGEVCLYYAAPEAPLPEPVLVLDGMGEGLINNLSVLSNVAPGYAPDGQALVSVVVMGTPRQPDKAIEADVRTQLAAWYGEEVRDWRHLKTYRIPYGLPDQQPPYLVERDLPVSVDGLFRCGDYLATASINGAMRSGRRAAEAVREALA